MTAFAAALACHAALLAAIAFEGVAQNLVLITDATDPPAVRALNTRTLAMGTMVEYTLADLAALGIDPARSDGENRTLRPSGIALLEGTYSDTIFWADAGAGAILGLRFDSSGMRVLARGLSMPEALLLDRSTELYAATGKQALYWGDSISNRIQRCLIDYSVGGAGNCTDGVSDVITSGVGHVAGLAHNPVTSRLYWADGEQMKVFSVMIDRATGAAQVAQTLEELVAYVAMPVALALEFASGASLGAERLYLLDQARPAQLSRVWLNGNDTQTLVRYGLSRPRAVGLAADEHFFAIADSGTKQVLVGRSNADSPGLREAYQADNFEPRGLVIRSDAEIFLALSTAAVGSQELDSAAPRRGGAAGSQPASWISTCLALVSAASLAASFMR